MVYSVPREHAGAIHNDSLTQRSDVVPGSCHTPVYPPALQQAGVSGLVIVGFIIDTLGRADPATIRVIQSDHRDFNAPAISAVRSCSYRPGELSGRKVRVWVQQPITFQVSH